MHVPDMQRMHQPQYVHHTAQRPQQSMQQLQQAQHRPNPADALRTHSLQLHEQLQQSQAHSLAPQQPMHSMSQQQPPMLSLAGEQCLSCLLETTEDSKHLAAQGVRNDDLFQKACQAGMKAWMPRGTPLAAHAGSTRGQEQIMARNMVETSH